MTSLTPEQPILSSIPYGGAASTRRSYSCYNCNYSFHITRTTTTTSYTSPSSFRCPRCHHRHLIPHHTVSPPPPPPPPNFSVTPNSDVYLDTSGSDYDSSDHSDSEDHYDFETPYTATLKSFVDSLPIRKFPPNPAQSVQSCSICMEDCVVNSDDSGAVTELPCKHCFHRDCIVEWLQRSNTCPLCRHKLPSDQEEVGNDESGTRDGLIVVLELARVRDDGIRYPNANGGELDAMRDEDGDTLMMDA